MWPSKNFVTLCNDLRSLHLTFPTLLRVPAHRAHHHTHPPIRWIGISDAHVLHSATVFATCSTQLLLHVIISCRMSQWHKLRTHIWWASRHHEDFLLGKWFGHQWILRTPNQTSHCECNALFWRLKYFPSETLPCHYRWWRGLPEFNAYWDSL